jgi:protein-L-isoaspartate(D-aspartate) O-methyltransferase
VNQLDEPRSQLVETLRNSGITDPRVLAAIENVPREAFVPATQVDRAYDNVALPIGQGQTISQPYVVALMTQELGLSGSERVLEIGTGSGYQTALLAALSRTVVSVERVPELLDLARRTLDTLGHANVELHLANGTLGWPDGAPYDRIIVTAAGPEMPSSLLGQLADGGRLVMPVGTLSEQSLVLVRRTGDHFERHNLGGVRFVPLVGEGGWSESSLPIRPDYETDVEAPG